MKRILIFLSLLVLLTSCSDEVTKPDFSDSIRVTFDLHQYIYPNPNNGQCDIEIYLQQDMYIELEIVNSQNEIINNLVDGKCKRKGNKG